MERRVYIKTYGCQMNERESEALSAVLKQTGYILVNNEETANIVLLNTCSVRDQAERKATGKANLLSRPQARLSQQSKPPKLIGILGCMAQNLGEALLKQIPSARLIVGPTQIARVPEYLEFLLKKPTERIVNVTYSPIDAPFTSAHDSQNIKPSAYVSIMQGCNMHCAYCIVPKTRGPEQYRPMSDIIREITWLAQHGTKEVTLLGQIVNRYGFGQFPTLNGKSPFVQLLEQIQAINGIQRIRFTSPHPTGFREDLIDAYKNLSKLCPYVHLPVQSGSDKILKIMRRPYKREQFLAIVNALRERVPTISISTDVIVGFPGETDADFEETATLFDRVRFDMAYIFKYSIRLGTVAETLGDQIADTVKEDRNQVLLQKLASYSLAYNEKMLGKVYEVLVEGKARRGEYRLEGRTPEHKKVIFEGSETLIGQLVSVQVTSALASTLEGKLVS